MTQDIHSNVDLTKADRPQLNVALWMLVLFCALIVGLESFYSPAPFPAITALAGPVLIAAILLKKRLVLASLCMMCASLIGAHVIGEAVINNPVRIYFIDLILGPMLISAILACIGYRRMPALGWHFLVIAVFGALWTAYGIANGNTPLDAVGVFRRLVFYPAAFVIAAVAFTKAEIPVKTIRRIAAIVGLGVAAICAYRLAVDHGYAHEYFLAARGVGRFISYIEAIGALFYLFVLLGDLVCEKKHRFVRVALLMLMLVALVASNYRTVWAATILSGVVWMALTDRGFKRIIKYGAITGALAFIVVTVVMVSVPPEHRPTARFSRDNLIRATAWRMGSYSKAIRVIAASPLTGTGFGYDHFFEYRSGDDMTEIGFDSGHTIHNDLLWLMVNCGLIGTVLILTFFLRWWSRCRNALRENPIETSREARLIAAAMATVVFAALLSMTQPLFSEPAPVVALYTLMAISYVVSVRSSKTAS